MLGAVAPFSLIPVRGSFFSLLCGGRLELFVSVLLRVSRGYYRSPLKCGRWDPWTYMTGRVIPSTLSIVSTVKQPSGTSNLFGFYPKRVVTRPPSSETGVEMPF